MLPLQTLEPDRLIRPYQGGLGCLGQLQKIITKASACLLALAAHAELLESEGADRLEHAEPELPVGLCIAPQQTLAGQRGQAVKDAETRVAEDILSFVDWVILPAHGCRTIRQAPSGEDRHASKQLLLVSREQVVAPANCAAHGEVPRGEILAVSGQELEWSVEPREDPLRGEHVHPGRGQLQGQGQTVQPHA